MEQRTLERIAGDFSVTEQASVAELLSSYAGPEAHRVRWDILHLSKGDLEKVRHYLHAAQTDYRDILYWAEYYDTDPMLKGRDPRKLVEDVLAKFGGAAKDSKN